MQWNSVKKPVKKRFLKHTSVRALLLLDAGNYPSRVARILGFSPQVLHYHIKKWLKMGWIKLDVKTPNMTTYTLEASVKKSLTGGESSPYKGVRLHAYSLKFPVLNGPISAVDWNRVQLANWSKLVGCECGLTVEKTTRHVIIHADKILSEDPNEARRSDISGHGISNVLDLVLIAIKLRQVPLFGWEYPIPYRIDLTMIKRLTCLI